MGVDEGMIMVLRGVSVVYSAFYIRLVARIRGNLCFFVHSYTR